jgi:iron complex transport system substrate-binding protein
MRIASLLASATELVCDLGAGDELVARSHECNYPAWVKRLPCASQPTFDITGSSKQIDALVRERLAAGKPLYTVDDALLLALEPDVIITQTHCEVCAVSPSNVGDELCRKQVAALSTGTLAGILDSFRQIANVIGRDVEPMIAGIEARIAEFARILAGAPRPTIACLEWIEPIFNMGNWGPELVERAGGIQLLGAPGAHSTTTHWEAIRDADPDYLLVAPCDFDLPRTLAEMHVMEARPGWRELRAVQEGRVFVADGDLYFNRSSPSVFTSIEILAEILHADRFPPTHAASWQRYVSRG